TGLISAATAPSPGTSWQPVSPSKMERSSRAALISAKPARSPTAKKSKPRPKPQPQPGYRFFQERSRRTLLVHTRVSAVFLLRTENQKLTSEILSMVLFPYSNLPPAFRRHADKKCASGGAGHPPTKIA